jgi:hypothetical protein
MGFALYIPVELLTQEMLVQVSLSLSPKKKMPSIFLLEESFSLILYPA